jgi:hypothetical protein
VDIEDALAVFNVIEAPAVKVGDRGSTLGEESAQLFYGFHGTVPRIVDEGVVVQSQ